MKHIVRGNGEVYATYDEAQYGAQAKTYAKRFVEIQKHKTVGAGLSKTIPDDKSAATAARMTWTIREE